MLGEIKKFEENIVEIESKYAEKSVIFGKINKISEKISQITEEMNREAKYNQLVTLYFDYLQKIRTNACPTCKSPIDYDKVISDIMKEISAIEKAEHLRKLRKELEELKNKKKIYEAVSEKLKHYEEELKRIKSKINSIKNEFEEKGVSLEEPLIESLENQLSKIEEEIKNVGEKVGGLQKTTFELNSKIEELKEILKNLNDLENQIQKIVNLTVKGEKLLEALAKKTEELKKEILELEKISKEIINIRKELNKYEKIVDLIVGGRRILELEGALPAISNRIKALEVRLERLRKLEIAISDIYEAAVLTRETAIQTILSYLQADMDAYYSKLMCHPFYIEMRLSPEKERGKPIYTTIAHNKDLSHSIYIQTRFSGAQMNSTSIALFFAMCKRLPSSLKLIILDDPCQSMDSTHKEALANLVNELSREKQIIIATQDNEFKKYLLEHMPKEGKVFIFEKWNTEGPTISIPTG